MMNPSNIGNAELAHMLAKTREAASVGPGTLSMGEALVAALILNRPDWLAQRSYTIAQALERVGLEWARLIPAAAAQITKEHDSAQARAAAEAHQAQLDEFSAQKGQTELRFQATYVTSGAAPGYRDVSFTFDLMPLGEGSREPMRATISLKSEDGERVVRHVIDTHRFAWRNGAPTDVAPGELRPTWIDHP